MGLLDTIKRKAAGKAVDVAGPIAARAADRALSSGDYGVVSMNLWKRFVAFMNGKKLFTGAALVALPKLAAVVAGALIAAGLDPVQAATYTAWGGGGALAIVGMIHKVVKWLDDITPDDINKAQGLVVLLAMLGSLSACGSLAQVRLGAEPKAHPDEKVVFARICANEPDAARLYLESPTFAWIGPVKERYLTDALMKKFAGECPCPGKECPKLEGSK